MSIFKALVEDDFIYVEAENHEAAHGIICAKIGPIPMSMIVWQAVDKLPEGETLINDLP